MRRFSCCAAAVAALLVIAGCGGSSTVADRQPAGTTPAGTRSPGAEPAVPGPDDFPPGKFTVQLGAYQSEDGAATVAAQARTRFTQDVFTVFNAADALFKVFLGVFDSKDLARNFRDSIVRRYPEEYRDAWVSDLAK